MVPPAPMAADPPMDDAKLLLPVAAEEPAGVGAVVSEEERGKKPEENQGDPKADGEKGEERGRAKEKEAVVQKSSSFKEESNFLSDLKEHERKALMELRAMVDEAVRANKLFPAEEAKGAEKKSKEEAKSAESGNAEAEMEKEVSKEEGRAGEHAKDAPLEEEKSKDEAEKEESKDGAEKKEEGKEDVKSEEHTEEEEAEKEESEEKVKSEDHTREEAEKKEEEREEKVKSEEHNREEAEKKEEAKSEEHTNELVEEEDVGESEERTKEVAVEGTDISLWGVPLLGSKGSQDTDVILLKFLRAREFRAKEAFEMLRSTLQWRKDARIDSILEEESLGEGLEAAAYMDGADREGHPVCYNIYGVFQDSALYEKAFGSDGKVEQFLRWRFQLMEKGIQKLELRPGGVASILQITDLKDSPGISKREIRAAMKRAVGLLQDNYPEFVAKNIFINVPFWYYAFNSLLSPFLTQRTKSKFVFARPARVTETLLKYIPAEHTPIRYGGLKRENDTEFSVEDGGVSELIVKSGATENVEIPIPEAGNTVVWDLTVVGWEVNYKEEFVPTDEASYTILIQKGKKMGSQEQAIRNSFRNNEPGKIVLIIENNTYWKKKVLYRYKTKSSS